MSSPTRNEPKIDHQDEDNQLPMNGDAIGDTVYSRSWLLGVLLKTVQFVDHESRPSDGDEEKVEEKEDDEEVDISSIETELCALWDMTTDLAVQEVLLEDDNFEVFTATLRKTKSNRLEEISLGILANLMHHKEICKKLSEDKDKDGLPTFLISLLSAGDVPLLTQLLRLLITGVSSHDQSSSQIWITTIKANSSHYFTAITQILANCLNTDLLKLTFDLLNRLLCLNNTENEDDQSLAKAWLLEVNSDSDSVHQAVPSLCAACTTILNSTLADNSAEEDFQQKESSESWTGISATSTSFFHHFWFIIQSLCASFVDQKDHHRNLSIGQVFSPTSLHNLVELLGQFDNLLTSEPNSLLSYTAACTFFATVFAHQQQLNDPANPSLSSVVQQRLREKIARLGETRSRAIKFCTSEIEEGKNSNMKDALEEALRCLRQFDQMLINKK